MPRTAYCVLGTTGVACSYTARCAAMEAVSYLRVSTREQGDSGLGIEAQRARVAHAAAARGAELAAEFVEIESGRKADRPQLAAALAEARRRKALLVVGKVDRLARDAEMVLKLDRETRANGMAGILFADLPEADTSTANGRMVLGMMASIAEWEAGRIAERTREALAAAKARGVKLGGLRPNTASRNTAAREKAQAGAERLRPVLAALQAQGASLRQMADALAQAGTTTRNGQPLSPSTVKLQLQRLGLIV